ncbi:MAG: hypothetical protein PVI21_06350 [Candidatus Woesebacteria bacterium]|jgi:hypothetical protein
MLNILPQKVNNIFAGMFILLTWYLDDVNLYHMKFLRKIPKSLRIFLSVELVIAVVAILAFYIPLSMSSGVERFEGDERKVADYIVREYDNLINDPIEWPYIKLRVENVQAQSKKDSVEFCHDNDRTMYTVDVTERTAFGIPWITYNDAFPTCE